MWSPSWLQTYNYTSALASGVLGLRHASLCVHTRTHTKHTHHTTLTQFLIALMISLFLETARRKFFQSYPCQLPTNTNNIPTWGLRDQQDIPPGFSGLFPASRTLARQQSHTPMYTQTQHSSGRGGYVLALKDLSPHHLQAFLSLSCPIY